MNREIVVAHDPSCQWCWIGLHQAFRLRDDFGVTLKWRGHELWPEELAFPDPTPPLPPNPRPPVPTRAELAFAAQGLPLPTAARPSQMRTHAALEVFAWAQHEGFANDVVEVVYRAHWERGEDISRLEVLQELCRAWLDPAEMGEVLSTKRYASEIVPFDDGSYKAGVYNVPTFFIGDGLFAEQPYAVLARAVRDWLG